MQIREWTLIQASVQKWYNPIELLKLIFFSMKLTSTLAKCIDHDIFVVAAAASDMHFPSFHLSFA